MHPVASPPTFPPPAAPEKTAAAVKEIVTSSKSVKKEMKLDHALLMSEVQLLLAEKRTAFALLRTGVTVSLVPVSIWTVLVATSSLYDARRVVWLLVPIMLLAFGLLGLGLYLVYHSFRQIQHSDITLTALRRSDTLLEDLLFAR